jgi:hypothetical protein
MRQAIADHEDGHDQVARNVVQSARVATREKVLITGSVRDAALLEDIAIETGAAGRSGDPARNARRGRRRLEDPTSAREAGTHVQRGDVGGERPVADPADLLLGLDHALEAARLRLQGAARGLAGPRVDRPDRCLGHSVLNEAQRHLRLLGDRAGELREVTALAECAHQPGERAALAAPLGRRRWLVYAGVQPVDARIAVRLRDDRLAQDRTDLRGGQQRTGRDVRLGGRGARAGDCACLSRRSGRPAVAAPDEGDHRGQPECGLHCDLLCARDRLERSPG